jgi:hypothetical protein
MQFSGASHHFIPLRSKYSLKYPVLKHLQSLCSSCSVRDPVPYPYKTIGKVIVLF